MRSYEKKMSIKINCNDYTEAENILNQISNLSADYDKINLNLTPDNYPEVVVEGDMLVIHEIEDFVQAELL